MLIQNVSEISVEVQDVYGEKVILAPWETVQTNHNYHHTSPKYFQRVEVARTKQEAAPKKEEPKVEDDSELESLRKQYEEKHGKPVSNFKKNDIEWIKSKL